jgi:hypothetical protein
MFNSPPVGHPPPLPTPTNGGMPGLVFPSSTPGPSLPPTNSGGNNPANGHVTHSGAAPYFVQQHQQSQQGSSAYEMSMMGLNMMPNSSMPGTPRTGGAEFGLSMVPEDVGVGLGLKGSMGGHRLSISNGSGPTPPSQQQQQHQQQQQRWPTQPQEWQNFDNYYGS